MGAMPEDQQVGIAGLVLKIVAQPLFFVALLFLPAGTLRCGRAGFSSCCR
jgi:hypothetical protein